MIIMTFRAWFEEKYGHAYPTPGFEMTGTVNKRIAEAVADYMDYVVQVTFKGKDNETDQHSK